MWHAEQVLKLLSLVGMSTDSCWLTVQRCDEAEEEVAEKKEEEEEKPDPLKQLITCLSRAATKEQQSSMPEDALYISYAKIMSQVPNCHS